MAKGTITHVVAIDLEMNKPDGEIIQLGACWGDVNTGMVIHKRSWHVYTPNEIHPYIKTLTGITTDDVAQASTLPIVMEGFINEQEDIKNDGIPIFVNPLTWGGGDTTLLKKSLPADFPWPFGRRWIDVKTVYVSMRVSQGEPIQGGLANAMRKVGLTFMGTKHTAQDDAVNTFRMYCELLKRFKK